MTIYLACDHQGITILEKIESYLSRTYSGQVLITWQPQKGDDYPDVAHSLVTRMENDPKSRGLLICGSSSGICMAANRYPWIRAFSATSTESVTLARRHQDANVMCISSWWSNENEIEEFINVFLSEPFEGHRHLRRLYKMTYKFKT